MGEVPPIISVLVYTHTMNIKETISRLFVRKKQQKQESIQEYMKSKRFEDALFKAAEEGARDQERYLSSLGTSFNDYKR